jgi:hypothetical protein
MERLNLATAGAADLIQPMDKLRQRKRRNLATGGVANLIHFMSGNLVPFADELTTVERLSVCLLSFSLTARAPAV